MLKFNTQTKILVCFCICLKVNVLNFLISFLVSEYSISSFPTFIVIDSTGAHTFEGTPSGDSLREFLEPYAKPLEKKHKGQSSQSKPKQSAPEPDRPAELIEITDQDSFQKNCLDKSGPSVIAIFDKTAEEFSAQQATLLQVAEKYKKQFRFLYADGPENPTFTEQLHLNSGYPQVIVLNPSKKVMATFIGSYEEAGVAKFLDKVLLGSRRTIQQLDTLPTFS